MRFVKQVLIFFGMKRAGVGGFGYRLFTVLMDAGARPVFADADAPRRVVGVDIVSPGTEVSYGPIVPTEILIEVNQLRIEGAGIAVAGVGGGGRKPSRIFRGDQLLELVDEIGRRWPGGKG